MLLGWDQVLTNLGNGVLDTLIRVGTRERNRVFLRDPNADAKYATDGNQD